MLTDTEDMPVHITAVSILFLALTLPAQVRWTRAPVLDGRSGHAMAYDSLRQRTVLFGGSQQPDTWEWYGTTWYRRDVAQPPGVTRTALSYDSTQATVLFGGFLCLKPVAQTWRWNGRVWTQLKPMISPPARHSHAMVFDAGQGEVVLFGGFDATRRVMGDTWLWNGTNWIPIPAVPADPGARRSHAMAYDPVLRRVVLFGGSNQQFQPFGDTWEWDGSTRTWCPKNPSTSPTARAQHTMAYDRAKQQVFLFGGEDVSGLRGDTWLWNGTNWIPGPAAGPGARRSHALAQDSKGLVLVGGITQDHPGTSDTWQWMASSWARRTQNAGPSPRERTAIAFDSRRGRAVLFGGNYNTPRNDHWEWDGTRWAEMTPMVLPMPRWQHSMVYDPINNRTVLFGGRNALSRQLTDTWEYDGLTWSQTLAPGPPSNVRNAFTFDSTNNLCVLLTDGFSPGNPIWQYDVARNTWLQAPGLPPPVPPPHRGRAFVYDPGRGVFVLSGGLGFFDTLEWDRRTRWTLFNPTNSPSPRIGHGMVYDVDRKKVVLFGGGTGFTGPRFNDVWEWNGNDWCRRQPMTSPHPRTDVALTYDTVGQRVLLFGAADCAADTWTYDPTTRGGTTQVGLGCPNILRRIPTITAVGVPVVGSRTFEVVLGNLGSGPAFFGLSANLGNVQFGTCNVYPGLPFDLVFGLPVTNQVAAFTLPIPCNGALGGGIVYTQGGALVLGGALLGLASLTPGLRIVIGD